MSLPTITPATIAMLKFSGAIAAIVIVTFGVIWLYLDKRARDATVRWLADDEEWEIDVEASMKSVPVRLVMKRRGDA